MSDEQATNDATDLLFGGMEKLGPGDDRDTLHVLRLLPRKKFDIVVDAGSGTGRQTLVLAKELHTLIHAVDNHEPFLTELKDRAKAAGVGSLVQTHCLDMKEIPTAFPRINLLWSEGAAYNIGFANALKTWAPTLGRDGFAVVSELSWLHESIPEATREYFALAYPDLHSIAQNVAIAEEAGYRVLGTHRIPSDSWVEGYYDILQPRASALEDHADPAVSEFARETLKEIQIFHESEGSYGYVFYSLQKA